MTMIGLDPATLDHRAAGHLMNGLVVPRPIAWVSTLGTDGVPNLAPHSYFMAVSCVPPIIMFSSTRSSRHSADGRKDTLRNIAATGEFVVNFVSADLLAPMNQTAADVPAHVDEFTLAGLQKDPSARVKPPRVAMAKAAYECRLHRILDIGDAAAIFGEVVYVQVDRDVWADGRIDVQRLNPLSRLGGSSYSELGTVVNLRRPEPAA